MRVVDLRNQFTNCNDQLIEICGDLIYYAEEKHEEGHHNLFILEYNQQARRERILASYFLSKPTLVQHFFSFPGEIMLVLEDGEYELRVLRIDKKTGVENGSARFLLPGEFCECVALDEERLLVYTNGDAMPIGLPRPVHMTRICVLYDLVDGNFTRIWDPRICASDAAGLVPFDANGERRLLLLCPHGTEPEKEKSFLKIGWLGEDVRDDVWWIPLLDFIVSAKAEEPRIPFERLFSAGTDGLARFSGMSGDTLYFRLKYYPKNDERLCAVDMVSGEKYLVAKLNLFPNETNARFHIDAENGRVYRITESAVTCMVEGVLNSAVSASYSLELGDFTACVEDRFIVAKYVLADEQDAFTFHSVFDSETGEQESYEGECMVKQGTIVLY